MKKTILIILALSVILGLASCRSGTEKAGLAPYSVSFEHIPFDGEIIDENLAAAQDYYAARAKEIAKDIPADEDFFKKLDHLLTADAESEMLNGHEYYEDDTDGEYSVKSDFHSRYLASGFVFDYYSKTITKDSVPYAVKYLVEDAPNPAADDTENYNRIQFAREFILSTCEELLGIDTNELITSDDEYKGFTRIYALLYSMNGNK